MTSTLSDICRIVSQCGDILLTADRSHMRIDDKAGPQNFVTTYDALVQQKLFEALTARFPDAAFFGEEGEGQHFCGEGLCFIVDPIDGTNNFIKDYRQSTVSVALCRDGAVEWAVICNPYTHEVFSAEKGGGAFLNGQPIHVSEDALSAGLVLFGAAPYYEELRERTYATLYSYACRAMDVRRSGSAALDLCYVACGRAVRFFELRLSPWDYAAGSLIVTEAGGKVTDMDGRPLRLDRPCSVLARNRD